MTKQRTVLFSAVIGLFVSVIAGFTHADRIDVAGIRIPYGLFLALTICVLTMLWLNRKFQTRLAGTVFLVIWVLVTLRMAIESNNGDLVFTVTWYSTTYIIAGAILLSMTSVMPAMRLPQKTQQAPPESQA